MLSLKVASALIYYYLSVAVDPGISGKAALTAFQRQLSSSVGNSVKGQNFEHLIVLCKTNWRDNVFAAGTTVVT